MKRFISVLLLICMVFMACDIGNGNNDNNTPIDPGNPINPVEPIEPVDPAFCFEEVYEKLIERVGSITSDDYTGQTGDEVGQIANCQYVCNAINAKWGTNFQPVYGKNFETSTQVANCEYLLKLVDKANNNTTTYGTSSYATKQIVDVIAVNDACNRLWKPSGKFVAVGSNNIAYSTDGINWTTKELSGNTWYGVCYGNGKFVAVGNVNGNARAAYSTDGINWTERTLSGYYKDVCYGNGRFVAVGYVTVRINNTINNTITTTTNAVAAYSTDGINWTPTGISTSTWDSVCYGDRFVAVNSNIVGYSTNGSSWSTKTLSGGWRSVCYGNGRYVTVGSNNIAYSTDGINWNKRALNHSWDSVCYGNGKFVAVSKASSGARAAYSTDGIDWTTKALDGDFRSVCYGDGKFVVVGYSISTNIGNDNLAYSTDGINWTTKPIMHYWNGVCYGGD